MPGGKSDSGTKEERNSVISRIQYAGSVASLRILLPLICASCTSLTGPGTIFAQPRPRTHFSLPASFADDTNLDAAVCIDAPDSDETVVPVLVAMANSSQTAWTVDASQISARAKLDGRKWLPIPPEEAARMAPVSQMDGLAALIERAGIFATYGAGLGASGGALAADAKGEDVSNGFQLGAAWGAVAGLVGGLIFEYTRLTYSTESKVAGDANEKMKFLALKDRSILYTGYSAVGYLYYSSDIREVGASSQQAKITIPFVRGDPSKDWTSPPTYKFPLEKGTCERLDEICQNLKDSDRTGSRYKECTQKLKHCQSDNFDEPTAAPIAPRRYLEFDLSPVVCNCTFVVSSCDRSSITNQSADSMHCVSIPSSRHDDEHACDGIEGGLYIPAATELYETSNVWQKNHFWPRLPVLHASPRNSTASY
jgi:hypothetical protein